MKRLCICFTAMIVILAILITLNARKNQIKYYEKNAEATSIRLYSDWDSDTPEGKCFQTIIDNFNAENPDITIKNDVVTGNDYFERLEFDFCSDNEPDIFISDIDENIFRYVESGDIEFYDEILNEDEEWYESFDKSIWNKITYNGKVFALPLEHTFVAVYCNEEILKECGIESYPKTYEDLLKSVRIISDKGYVPIAFSALEDDLLLLNSIIAKCGGKFYSDYREFETDGINPNFIKAVKILRELYENTAFSKNLYSMSEKEANELFLTKQAAFIVRDAHFYSEVYETFGEGYKSVSLNCFPSIKDEKSLRNSFIYGTNKNSIFMCKAGMKDEKKREAIIKFVKYITSVKNMDMIKSKLGAISTVDSTSFSSESPISMVNTYFVYTFMETVDMPSKSMKNSEWNNLKNGLPMYLDHRKEIEDLFENKQGGGNEKIFY